MKVCIKKIRHGARSRQRYGISFYYIKFDKLVCVRACVRACICVLARGDHIRIEYNRYYYRSNRGFSTRTKDDGMSFLENYPITEVKMFIYIYTLYYIRIYCEKSGGVNSAIHITMRYKNEQTVYYTIDIGRTQ